MAARRWLRLDAGWMDSEWLALLSPGARLAWIALLSHVKLAGSGGAVKAVSAATAARKWDIPGADVEAMLTAAYADEAIDFDVDGDWIVVHWTRYQEPDSTATQRKRNQRDRESRRDNRDTLLSRVTTVTEGVTTVTGGVTRRATGTGTGTGTETEGAPGEAGKGEIQPSECPAPKRREADGVGVVGQEQQPAPALLTYPCSGTPSTWGLTDSQVEEWHGLYPGLDVLGEARKALAWVLATPSTSRRKTARGMKRFLVGWLGRATDRGPSGKNGQVSAEYVPDFAWRDGLQPRPGSLAEALRNHSGAPETAQGEAIDPKSMPGPVSG